MVLSSALPSNTAPDRLRAKSAKLVAIEARNVADDADVAEVIERAFVDREGQRKSLRRGIVFGLCRDDAGIGIALAAVVQPQLLRSCATRSGS